jgi:hypothetical protein
MGLLELNVAEAAAAAAAISRRRSSGGGGGGGGACGGGGVCAAGSRHSTPAHLDSNYRRTQRGRCVEGNGVSGQMHVHRTRGCQGAQSAGLGW